MSVFFFFLFELNVLSEIQLRNMKRVKGVIFWQVEIHDVPFLVQCPYCDSLFHLYRYRNQFDILKAKNGFTFLIIARHMVSLLLVAYGINIWVKLGL